MTILNDFLMTDSIRLDDVGLNIDLPPHLIVLGVPAPGPLLPPGPTTRSVPCVTKRIGSLDATLTIFGIPIPFHGTSLGEDSMGRWLIRWSVDDRMPRPFMMLTTIHRIQGQVTVAIAPLEPARTDLMTCADAAGEFFVTLSLLRPEQVEERFQRPPNEINLEADMITPTHAFITNVRGDAGMASPPPTPWPQPAWVIPSITCVTSALVTRTVFVEVRLDRPVLRSHTGFDYSLTAQGVDPFRELTVRRRPAAIGSSSVYGEVFLPTDLTGRVRVTAFTNDRSRARSAEFYVSGPGLAGCSDSIDFPLYDAIRVGCEAYDCGWTGLNDLAELIGRSGGWAVRYLTTRRMIDPVGQLVGELAVLRAINNHGRVVGIVDYGDGKLESFIYGELPNDKADKPQLQLMPGLSLHALNDADVAAGSRFDGKRTVPVRWVDGKLEEIDVKSANAVALAINGAGHIAGIHTPEVGGSVRGFVLDDKGFSDLGVTWGDVVTVVMNDAGSVAGTVLSKQKLRGFVYTPKTGCFDLKVPVDSGHSAVSGINDAGIIVGTFQDPKNAALRGFRFTATRGTEDLNNFINPDSMVVVESAVAINNLGQILTVGSQKGERGYFLLNPISIPTPQLPIP